MLLTDIRLLVTQDSTRRVLEHVDLLVHDGRIVAIGPDLAATYPDEERLDCRNKLVMPGLINCHTHLGMGMLRGISDDEELEGWLKRVVDAEHRMTDEEVATGAHLGVAEAIRTGTTTIADMYDPIMPSILTAQDLGVRLHAFSSFFLAHRALEPDAIAQEIPEIDDPCITVGIGPHSIYGTTESFLKATRKLATEQKIRTQMHLSETRAERAEFRAKHGMLPVEWLDRIGFLGPDVMLVHAVWLTKGELDLIAKRGCKIVHCPQSNMKLAGGSAMPLREMRERGITVALGTDSVVSNNSLDMFREMHTCALLHKHHYWDPTAGSAQEVLDMATRDAAHALGRDDIGEIAVGKRADLITLDLTDTNLQPIDAARAVSHLVHAASGMNVADVMVDGEMLLRDKRTVGR